MSSVSEDCGRQTSVVIGGLPINIQSADSEFIAMLERRYAGFLASPQPPASGSTSRWSPRRVTEPMKTSKCAMRTGVGA